MMQWLCRRRWLLILAVVAVVCALLYMTRNRAPEVTVTEACEGPLYLRITTSGLVEANSADLGFRGSGEMTNLYVSEGDRVSRSQLLARIAGAGLGLTPDDSGDVIRAPYDGTIIDVYMRPGAVVATGVPVLRITDTSPPWVTAFIDSEDALYLQPGDRLRCRVGGYLSEPWEVVVRSVGREAVPRRDLAGSAHQVRARCQIVGKGSVPPPGTEVDVDGEIRMVHHGVLIPTAAVRHEGAHDWVWVVEGNCVYRRDVLLGPNNFDLIHIREGLRAAERVVVHGKTGLTEGSRVRARPMPPMTEGQAGEA